MKNRVVLALLVVVFLLCFSGMVTAAHAIMLTKDVAEGDIIATPVNLTFHIYDSELGVTPIAFETFAPGAWSADYDFTKVTTVPESMVRFKVNFTDTGALTSTTELWVEMEIDGRAYGRARGDNQRAACDVLGYGE